MGEYHAEAFPPRRLSRRNSGAGFGQGLRCRRNAARWWIPRWISGSPPAASRRSSRSEFARWFGVRDASLVNSGSSANLLALYGTDLARTWATAGSSPAMKSSRVAAGFPTTVNPIIQNGLVPVFVDVDAPDLQHRRDAARSSAFGRAPAPS